MRRCVMSQISEKYNLKITHETMRIGVCDTLDELLVPDKEVTNCFADIIKWHFVLYFDRYMEIVQKHQLVTGRSVLNASETLGCFSVLHASQPSPRASRPRAVRCISAVFC
jgi:hypothetical protein